ncbi:MAG: flagellar motor switch protein FliM [Desulfohalobiaceae bacterium]|nr:flagellar motor switch protein FliM [Desulfohalobiaceae bacterium]
MEKYLTQEEINDLLDAIRSGEIDLDSEGAGDAASDRGVEKLDLFRGQGAGGRGRIANFDIILDAFARHCGISQANRLKQTVSVKRVAIETEVFENFVRNLQEHGVIAILRFEPLESGGLLILDSTLAFGLIEIMLGATTEDNLHIPDREMSIIEMNILKDVINDICTDWEKAFEPLEEMQCSLVQVETNPRMVNIVTPDTEVLISRFSVNAGNLFGQMSMVMPYFALEPYKEQLKNRMLNIASLVGSRTWASELKSELVQVRTQITAQFAELSMSLRQILNLQEEDILSLDRDMDDPVEVLVGDKAKFQGVAGSKKGKKAIRITGVKNVLGGEYGIEG